MKSHLKFVLSLLLFACSGCALPVPPGEELGDFVPKEELTSVSLIREGMAYFNQGRYIDAELKFRQARYLNPTLANIRTNLAATLERSGNYEEAEALYQDLIKEDPAHVQYFAGLARVYYGSGKFDQARKMYEQALVGAYDLNDIGLAAQFARSLAALCFKSGEEECAVCYSGISFAIKNEPGEYFKHVRLLLALGRADDALALSTRFAAEHNLDRDPLLLHERALSTFALENYKEALSFERVALEGSGIDPNILGEMNMVRNFALLEVPDELSQSKFDEDAQEAFFEEMRDLRKVNSGVTLYWPLTLLEHFYAVPEE